MMYEAAQLTVFVKHVRCFLQILGYFDYAFTAIFTVEIVLKVNVLCPLSVL